MAATDIQVQIPIQEPLTSSCKRARTSKSEESDETKKRRRPRVDKQDESAADRRRTQIRMAQRAYRQRKDSTLEELRRRVSELTGTIELINKTFTNCGHQLLADGLSEAQRIDLQETMDQCSTLAQSARYPSDDQLASETEDRRRSPTTADPPGDGAPAILSAENGASTWLTHKAPASTTFQQDRTLIDVGDGYSAYMPEAEANTPVVHCNVNGQHDTSRKQSNLAMDYAEMFRADLLNRIPIVSDLSPPITYSFQETSFARRLHCASYKRDYQLLLDPSRWPNILERVFALYLMGRDRQKLTDSIKEILWRGLHEPLDYWEAPLIHIGGAGTHYPRRDQYGNLLPKKLAVGVGLIGPRTLALLDNAARDNMTVNMTVEVAGFEGEWFDPFDVQGYLEEIGIYIDPQASFSEAEVTEWPPLASCPSLTDSSTSSDMSARRSPRPLSSRGLRASFTQDQLFQLAEKHDSLENDLDLFDTMVHPVVGYSNAQTGPFMNFIPPSGSETSIPQTSSASTASIWDYQDTADSVQNQASSAMDMVSMTAAAFIASPQIPLPRKKRVIIDTDKLLKR